MRGMINDYANNEYCNPFDEKPQNFFMKLEHCGRYLYALDVISNSSLVADISCATGYGSALLATKAKYVLGCDINSDYLNVARQVYRQKNLEFVKVDLTEKFKLPHDVDTIISFETIEHTSSPFVVVKKFYDILPQGGKLVLSFPNADYEQIDALGKSKDPFHLSVIKYNEMIEALKKIGFHINGVLGQSFINKIISQLVEMERYFGFSFDNLYNYQKENVLKQSRILAYPNTEDIEKSYSFIFDLIKS